MKKTTTQRRSLAALAITLLSLMLTLAATATPALAVGNLSFQLNDPHGTVTATYEKDQPATVYNYAELQTAENAGANPVILGKGYTSRQGDVKITGNVRMYPGTTLDLNGQTLDLDYFSLSTMVYNGDSQTFEYTVKGPGKLTTKRGEKKRAQLLKRTICDSSGSVAFESLTGSTHNIHFTNGTIELEHTAQWFHHSGEVTLTDYPVGSGLCLYNGAHAIIESGCKLTGTFNFAPMVIVGGTNWATGNLTVKSGGEIENLGTASTVALGGVSSYNGIKIESGGIVRGENNDPENAVMQTCYLGNGAEVNHIDIDGSIIANNTALDARTGIFTLGKSSILKSLNNKNVPVLSLTKDAQGMVRTVEMTVEGTIEGTNQAPAVTCWTSLCPSAQAAWQEHLTLTIKDGAKIIGGSSELPTVWFAFDDTPLKNVPDPAQLNITITMDGGTVQNTTGGDALRLPNDIERTDVKIIGGAVTGDIEGNANPGAKLEVGSGATVTGTVSNPSAPDSSSTDNPSADDPGESETTDPTTDDPTTGDDPADSDDPTDTDDPVTDPETGDTDDPTDDPVTDAPETNPSTGTPDAPATVETVTVYRLLNPYTGEHLYTEDVNEYDSLAAIGWNQEGEAWTSPKSSVKPIYRLFNPNNDDHHYTTDKNEYETLATLGWNKEGAKLYSADEASGIPVYRLFNDYLKTGKHLFTKNAAEYEALGAIGWVKEEIAWYAVA